MSGQTEVPTAAPASPWPAVPRNKWEREYRAFLRLLPQLLETERGKYVAIHEERVIDSDTDEMALILRVLARLGNVDIHVGRVTDQPEPVCRSGVVRGKGMKMNTPRRGRPPKATGKAKDEYLETRLSAAEKQTFRDAADLAGLDLSAWVREGLRLAARQELEAAEQPIAFLNQTSTRSGSRG